MSTPVGSMSPLTQRPEHKRSNTEDLQEQMQHMIRLQYEQQRYMPAVPKNSSADLPPLRPPAPRTAAAASSSWNATAASTTASTTAPQLPRENGVGQGTLLFATPDNDDMPRPIPRKTENEPLLMTSPSLPPHVVPYGSTSTHQSQTTMFAPLRLVPSPPVPDEHNMMFHDDDQVVVGESPTGCCNGTIGRLLCFGAIDGILTGSGIWATFQGMQLLLPTENQQQQHVVLIHTAVVCFTTAACLADALCIGLGNVWTTHVVAVQQARERTAVSQTATKAELVDLLLQRGMLKIDACSLADTLEGYPDMFVAAILGESLVASSATSPKRNVEQVMSYGQLFQQQRQQRQQQQEEDDGDDSSAAVRRATDAAWQESCVTMLGFSVSSIIPSLLFCFLSASSSSTATFFHPSSLLVGLLALFMGLLGFWKSRLLNTSDYWILFALEAITVLLICLAAAYTTGYVLQSILLGEDQVYLTIAKSPT